MSTTNDIFLTTNTGTWHWSIHYRASGRKDWVWTYNGELVIADAVSARRRKQVRMILRNVEGAPKCMPSMSLAEFRKACKPTHKTLTEVVFG